MKKMRFVHLIVLLALLLAVSLQPANGQTPAEGSPAIDTPSTAGSDGEITPLTLSLGGSPDYDSNWVAISQGQTLTFTHNLGGSDTDKYWVDLEYWNGITGINKTYYGGADINSTHVGVYWRNLTTTSIKVTRRANDPNAVKVRVRIWNELPLNPTYNNWNFLPRSGIYSVSIPSIDPDKNIIDLRFNDSGTYGINQRFYGGKDCGPTTSTDCAVNVAEGANWYGLATGAVSIFRQENDTSLGPPTGTGQQFHIQIWDLPKPTYNSDWQVIGKGSDLIIPHNIGGNANDYVVDLQFKSDLTDVGINQLYFGGVQLGSHSRPVPINSGSSGEQVGAYWNNLTNSAITVHRNQNDYYADQVRVRIWNIWKPTAPDYPCQWFTVNPYPSVNQASFNIPGGLAANYLVDMRFKNPTEGINQHNYGLNELGSVLDQGHAEDNVGAYWNNLTDNSITVTRAPQDATVAQACVRIWKMPTPDYDSAWMDINPNKTLELTHDLGGSKGNYLVDLQFQSPGYGINQGGYGGYDTGTHSMTGLINNQQVGAFWSRLTPTSISVTRRTNDIYASQVRVRIWRLANPNYDSGLKTLLPGQTTLFAHSLNQDPDKFFISTTFFNGEPAQGYNQAYFGGGDLWDNSRMGAYWYGLTPTQILMYDRTNDTYAPNAEVRIWVTDFSFYMPVLKK